MNRLYATVGRHAGQTVSTTMAKRSFASKASDKLRNLKPANADFKLPDLSAVSGEIPAAKNDAPKDLFEEFGDVLQSSGSINQTGVDLELEEESAKVADKLKIDPDRGEHHVSKEKPVFTEVKKGTVTSHSFQTETSQMLDIVTNSLYSEKEVFLRELISNASDALEKARFLQSKEKVVASPTQQLEIKVFSNEEDKTVIIQDNGVGMTAEELVNHLGTIARSGSKAWAKDAEHGGSADNIIGQFGVGFYSGFMVGSKIEVYSKSCKLDANGKEHPGQYWVSDGTGTYDLCEAEGVERGTKIIIHLRDKSEIYAETKTLDKIIKKYSKFVSYPIYLNGVKVNTIQAIWNMNRNEVTEAQHGEFYRYIATAYDTPTYRLHFNAEIPIQINALLYFPERHLEKYGMSRMEPGTSLYSRKVLIKANAKGLLPDYMRFIKGVVDSEDIPLNISRENMQDSLLVSRISSVLTKRVIKHLQDEARKDPAKYTKWYTEYSPFIKEGVCSDFTHKAELAKLLRFDSSESTDGRAYYSLDDYLSRMPPNQQKIFYLCAPNRAAALSSPYYQAVKSEGFECLFMYHPLDEFTMKGLREYQRRKIVSAETSTIVADDSKSLEEKHQDTIAYVREVLKDYVKSVLVSSKGGSDHPAWLVDHEGANVRKLMRAIDAQGVFGDELPMQKQKLAINPTHPMFVKIMKVKDVNPTLAKNIVEQIHDNALIAADLMDNPRTIIPRINTLLNSALDSSLEASLNSLPADQASKVNNTA